jgi:hypothetical protein
MMVDRCSVSLLARSRPRSTRSPMRLPKAVGGDLRANPTRHACGERPSGSAGRGRRGYCRFSLDRVNLFYIGIAPPIVVRCISRRCGMS